jgi:hypothetical protein
MTEETIEEVIVYLERHENLMSLSQISFVNNIKKSLRKGKKISYKQEGIIREIRKYL